MCKVEPQPSQTEPCNGAKSRRFSTSQCPERNENRESEGHPCSTTVENRSALPTHSAPKDTLQFKAVGPLCQAPLHPNHQPVNPSRERQPSIVKSLQASSNITQVTLQAHARWHPSNTTRKITLCPFQLFRLQQHTDTSTRASCIVFRGHPRHLPEVIPLSSYQAGPTCEVVSMPSMRMSVPPSASLLAPAPACVNPVPCASTFRRALACVLQHRMTLRVEVAVRVLLGTICPRQAMCSPTGVSVFQNFAGIAPPLLCMLIFKLRYHNLGFFPPLLLRLVAHRSHCSCRYCPVVLHPAARKTSTCV